MIIFRTDANKEIGSGHVMRCLSLAKAFHSLGKEILFVMAADSFVEPVKQNGFGVEVLQTVFSAMEAELLQLDELLKRLCPKLVVVDSYYVTELYLKTIQSGYFLAYIDDLAAFAYPADCLINYNAYGEALDYRGLYAKEKVRLPKLCLGVRYAPLREEFENAEIHKQPLQCRDVLISTGGADLLHLALQCVQYLQRTPEVNRELCFHFVLGALNPDMEEIEALTLGMDNIRLHKEVKDMKGLMQQCDLAVSAAGSTLYELCACGLPTITYVLADNQIPGAEAFERQGLMVSIGDLRETEEAPKKIFDAVDMLNKDYEKRRQFARRMQQMVDGRGAERLARALVPKETKVICSYDVRR